MKRRECQEYVCMHVCRYLPIAPPRQPTEPERVSLKGGRQHNGVFLACGPCVYENTSHDFCKPRVVVTSFDFDAIVCVFSRPTLLESVRLLYQGMLRTLLVLLHDFPEFLSDYHLSFCDVIPAACIQLRNLILAAFPRSMRLPDPFTPNLKVQQSSAL